MKTIPRLCLLAGLILALTGCQTVNNRIAEKSSVFAALDPAAQAKLKQGIVSVGDTPDMAYIALGAPDQKRIRQTAAGTSEIWIYRDDYGYSPGSSLYGYYGRGYGYRSWSYMDPYFPYYGMRFAGPHHGRHDESTRVTFESGRAVEVEQPKPRT